MAGKEEQLVNQVISMRFENRQFQNAAAETIKSLGRLEDSCKSLNGVTSGLSYFSKAVSGLTAVPFSGMSKSVHTVVDGFSVMGTIGDTVLRNLTNRVTDFVVSSIGRFRSFASSLLGLESIMGGFSEYEDKMGSIQTIKTNTEEAGVTLDDITKTLDELNHYADQTIYSFKEMTRNIGTFTAAGVSLEDSATAIKGISNLAAGVGSTPQQAANAMYQLSQALASGTVNLQDWNSVVNAGMGGAYFQNALKATAKELAEARGIAFKEFEGTFRESISGNAKGAPWLTSEVLLETLKKFANDPSLMEAATRVKTFTQLIDTMKESVGSGWTETWEYLIGNLDEAGDFFTMISQGFDRIVGSASESRNAMMKFWHDNGGRDKLIEALVTGFRNLADATKPIRQAFSEVFPPITKERLLEMTDSLLNFVSGLKLTEPQLDVLHNVSERAFGALKVLLSTFKGLGKVAVIVGGKQIPDAFGFLAGIISKAEKTFRSFVGFLEHFLSIDLRVPGMDDFEKFGNLINSVIDTTKRKFTDGKSAISRFYATFANGKVKAFVDKLSVSFGDFFQNLTIEDLKDKFQNAIVSVRSFFGQFSVHLPTLSDFQTLIGKVLGTLKFAANTLKGLGKVAVIVGGKQIPDAFRFLTSTVSKAGKAFQGFVGFVTHFLGIDFHPPSMDSFEDFGNSINDAIDAAKRKFTDGKAAVSNFYATLANGKVKAFIDRMANAFRNLTIDDLKRKFQNAVISVKSFFKQFGLHLPTLNEFLSFVKRVVNALGTVFSVVLRLGKVVVNVAGKLIPVAFRLLVSVASIAKRKFQDFVGVLERFLGIDFRIPTMRDFENFGYFIVNTLGAAKRKFTDAKNAVSNFYASLADGKVKAFVDRLISSLGYFLRNLTLKNVQEGFRNAADSVMTFFGHFTAHLPSLSAFLTLIQGVLGVLKDLFNTIKFWVNNGGLDQIIKTLVTGFDNLNTATKPIRRAFMEAFPPMGKKRLLGMTEGILNFVASLKPSVSQLEFTRNASDRVFGAFKSLTDVFKGLGKVALIVGGKQIPDAFNFLMGVASKAETAFQNFVSLLEHFLGIKFHTSSMDDFETFGNLINDTLDTVKQKFTDGKTAVSEFYAAFADGKVKTFVDSLTSSITNFFRSLTLEDLKSGFQNAIGSVKSFFEQFDIHIPTLSDFWNLIDSVATGVWNLGEKFQNAAGKVSDFFISLLPLSENRKFGFGKNLSDETGEMADNVEENVGRTKTAFDYLIGAIDFAFDTAGHIISRFVDIFRPVWDLLLQGFSDVIEDASNLTFLDIMKIATVFMTQDMYGAITEVMKSLGGLGETLTGIGESVSGFVGGAKGIFDTLGDTLGKFQESVNAQALINVAIAVAILSGSVIALSLIDVDAGLNALFSISMLVGEMLGAMTVLSKVAIATGKLRIDTLPIVIMSAAVVILAGALAKLAALDTEKLGNGLLGITALITEMTAVAILLGRYGTAFGKGMTSLLIMAFAISKLATVIIELGAVELGALLQGGAAVGAIMAAIIALSYALWAAPTAKLVALGEGIVLLAFGIKILTGAVQALGSLDSETLLKGGAALGVMAVGIIAFSYALWAAPVAKLIVVGLGLTVIAAGMTALATAAFLFSRFSWSSLAKAGAAFGGILALSAIASHLINPLTLIAIAGALTVLGVALFGVAVDFKILSSIELGELVIAIASLASVLFLVGVAGALLGPMVPVILSLSGAILVLGVAIGLLGIGSIALSTGLAALGPGIVIAAASVGAALAAFIASVIEGAAEILHALSLMGVSLAEAFRSIGLALVEAVVSLAIPLAQGITVLIIALLDILTQYTDPLIDKIINFLDKFLDRLLDDVIPSVEDWLWKVVVKVADLLLTLLEGLLGSIPGIGPMAKDALQSVRDNMNEYWDNIMDARQINRRTERKMRMIEEGLVDAAGNVNIAGAGSDSAQAYVDDFLKSLRNGAKDISHEAGNISGIMGTIRRNTGDTSGRSGSFDDAVDSATRSVGKYSGSVGDFSKTSLEMTDDMNDISESADDMSANLSEKMAVARDVISGKYGNGDERRDILQEAGYNPDEIQNAVNKLLSGEYDIESITDNIGDSVGNATESMDGLGESSEDSFAKLVESAKSSMKVNAGFDGLSENVKEADFQVEAFSGAFDNISDSLMNAESGADNFSGSLDFLSTSVQDATSDASGLSASLEQMWAELEANRANTFASGGMWTDGYASGIASLTDEVKNSSAGIGNVSLDALAESIDAHSPSRKTAELASMWGEGFVGNIENLANPAYRAGYQVGERSVEGLENQFSAFNSNFDDLYSFSPTVTPILDLSDVESGMYYLQNEFGNAPAISVNQTWTPDIRNAEALLSLERPETDVNRIIDEMGYLRDDIVYMANEISRMKVYLDTGALVGEMSAPMDAALGQSTRRSIRSGRR